MGVVKGVLRAAIAAGGIGLGWPTTLHAAEPAQSQPSREEIEAWLDSNAVDADVARAEEPLEGLPPPPRHHGWLLESGIGAFGQLGELRHVSPMSPRFLLRAGYEFTPWFFPFAEADTVFSSTRYAPQPPAPRGYALFGFGAGMRFTLQALDWLGAYVQGSLGVSRVNEDVLATYGYPNTTSLSPYFGGTLGLVAYLPSPHLRLLLEGGVRDTPLGLDREASSTTPLSWIAGPSIAYAF